MTKVTLSKAYDTTADFPPTQSSIAPFSLTATQKRTACKKESLFCQRDLSTHTEYIELESSMTRSAGCVGEELGGILPLEKKDANMWGQRQSGYGGAP